MFIPSTFKRPVSSWKALNLRKTLLMASSVRLKPLNCSCLPCVYAQETLTFLLTQKKTFFFSSRRRHTRWTGDWSSDVCSSDLRGAAHDRVGPLRDRRHVGQRRALARDDGGRAQRPA